MYLLTITSAHYNISDCFRNFSVEAYQYKNQDDSQENLSVLISNNV